MSLGKQILRGIFGPSSATDEALPRFDGTTGKLLQNSGVTLDDDNNIVFPNGSSITVDAIIAASASGLKLFDKDGKGLFVADGGNLGKGTDDPGAQLEIVNDQGDNALIQLILKGLATQTANEFEIQYEGGRSAIEGLAAGSTGILRVRSDAASGGGMLSVQGTGSGPFLFFGTVDDGDLYAKVGAFDSVFNFQANARPLNFRSDTLSSIVRMDDVTGNVGVKETSPQERFAVAGNIVIPKTSGVGIKVDNTTPTFGWRDLKGKVTQRNTGASKPTHTTYRDTLAQFQFAAGKEEYFTYHIDHDHKPDSDIFLHVHWSHTSAQVNGGSLLIEYEMSYAKGFNQGAFPASVSSTYLGTASITQYQHIISEIQVSAAAPNAASEIDSNDLEPDGIIEARVKILENNITVSGGGVPDPFIHEADIHYQSTSMGTKQREPDFYT